jgi:hypothetical protein
MHQRDELLPEYQRDEVLPNYLEADQLAAETSRPVPRANLSQNALIGLWALRVFVVVAGVMVVYVFVSQLGH